MHPTDRPADIPEYDLAICGAGLAGLTLARQARLQLPQRSVVVLDKLSRPLPEAAFKVGESMVETGSFYLSDTLGLKDYLDTAHLRKLGFRFFFQDGSARIQDRPEFGLSIFPRVTSYQIDRGLLENDLRQFNEEDGVVLMEGCAVQEIALSKDGSPHEVTYRSQANGTIHRLKARWVVDAMGRRRYLQKKLDLSRSHGKPCSAVWFRHRGRIDVQDLVPAAEKSWHERVPGNNRYYSTNHLMGNGYWVWLIPLSTRATSIGIVALEDLHPFDSFNTHERALNWLDEHEPELGAHLRGQEPMDFRCMRQYSYASRQLFSIDRWACVGESALFPDPFYALASDLIGFSNTIITELIRLDFLGELTPDVVERHDRFVLALNHWLTGIIQGGYAFFGSPVVMASKVMWDTAGGWANLGPQMFNHVFLNEKLAQKFREVSGRFFFLTRIMQKLFQDWAENSRGTFTYDFLDFLSFPLLRELQIRNLRSGKSPQRIVMDQIINMQKLEELALSIFLLAVEDVHPEHLERLTPPVWINAWAISLQPENWDRDGLLDPITEPRDLTLTWESYRQLFQKDPASVPSAGQSITRETGAA